MERDTRFYSFNMPISSQLQVISDFSKPDIGIQIQSIVSALPNLVPEINDKTLKEQVLELSKELNIPAYQGVLERNQTFLLSSNQLFALVEEIASEAETKMELYNHNPEQYGRLIQSQFNAGSSNYLNPDMRNLSEDRRLMAEEMLYKAMGAGPES